MNQADIIKLKRLLEKYRKEINHLALQKDIDAGLAVADADALIEYIEYDLKNPENQP